MVTVEAISSSVVPEDDATDDESSELPSSFVFSSLFPPLELSGLFFLGVSCGLPEAIEGVADEGAAGKGAAAEGAAIEGVAIEGVALEGVDIEGVDIEPGVTDDVLGAGVGTVAGTGAGVGVEGPVHGVLTPPPSHPAAQVHVYLFAPFAQVDAPPQLTPSHGAEVGQDRDPKPCA